MPLYEYQCEACGARFELIRKFSDPPLEECSKCGKGPVQKLVSSPAFQFKGSGWYITDYARKSDGGAAATSEKATDKSESSGGADKAGATAPDSGKTKDASPAPAPAPAASTKDK